MKLKLILAALLVLPTPLFAQGLLIDPYKFSSADYYVYLYDEFVGLVSSQTLGWENRVNSGTITEGTTTGGDSIHFGKFDLRTSASGQFPLKRLDSVMWTAGARETLWEWVIRPSHLSDGTDTYTAYIGFFDASTTTNIVDGLWFEYSHGVNSGNWQCKTATASSVTTNDTSVAVVAATWVTNTCLINAAGTQAIFSVNGAPVATNVSNIPTGANFTGPNIMVSRTAGSATRNLTVDRFSVLFK